ncbi:hypothetical protein JHS3_19930 [Jeongeupia sp. HS-3]|uniref:DUF5710 domain-containing protein n=1 Tax=Jeongeupia sp. HS-3 TaxID=1009682 RepID=UPI0018A4BDF4|nr:DUF5710 domain-containing protein [Jeongeupia sp. HS-3]BCL76257.1 hypothetical protein JHS3_19930 [Jeongeupia sp. HS-3]
MANEKPAQRAAATKRVQLYLAVPFAEKDAAKALGARWDAERKKWYVPHGVDIAPFKQWLAADETASLDALSPAPTAAPKPKKAAPTPRAPTIPAGFVAYSGETPPWE